MQESPAAGVKPQRHFASDNYAGVCPQAWAAMEAANMGHAAAYGEDFWTARAADAFRNLFETACEVFFVFNGTAANALALSALCQSFHSVICSSVAHVETDECGAPEFFSNGSKLLVAPSADGKLTPEAIRNLATNRNDIHFPKPRVVTITQPTETGQVYSLDELRAISACCHELGLSLHMDGARFANACASLGCSPADLPRQSRGAGIAMRGIAQPGPGFEHADPGRRQKPHLGRQLSGLLAAIIKILREFAVEEQDRFAHGHAVLGATEAEHVDAGAPCQVGGTAAEAGAGIGKARAVHVQA